MLVHLLYLVFTTSMANLDKGCELSQNYTEKFKTYDLFKHHFSRFCRTHLTICKRKAQVIT